MGIINWFLNWKLKRDQLWIEKKQETLNFRQSKLEDELKLKDIETRIIEAQAERERAKINL